MKVKALCRVLAALLGAAIYGGTLTAQVPPPQPPWKCPGNVVNNGGFDSNTVIIGDGSMPASHTDNWTLAYGTPQLQSGAGCHDPDYISFWGNQAVGEAIQEPVTFLAGHTYNITFCARFHPDQGKVIPYVNIVLRGSATSVTSPACPAATCEVITTTSNISSLTWNTYTACWTPKRNESWLTISPSNGSSANDGAQTSFGQVDDVCIREIPAPVIDGPKTTCTGPATYCIKPPATGPFTWNVTNGTFQPANSDGSCILVTWNQGNPNGSVHVTSNAGGCPVTSNLNVSECPQPPCCHDVLKASLVSSTLFSGGAALTFNLGGPQATSVKATILSASHVPVPASCGPTGPITATVSSTQPSPPAGWNGPVVPFLNGNQAVWQSIPNNGSPLGQFTVNVQLPPAGSGKCSDTVTICIEFEITLAATPTSPCHTCTIVQCFTFKR